MIRLVLPLTALTLVSCTQDTGVAIHNSPPEVAFVLPADGSWAYTGTSMDFVATITDDITANVDLTFAWTSNQDGYINGDEEVLGDTVTMTILAGLSLGEHIVTLQVIDGDGESAEDTVTLEMVQNDAPSASFIKPQADDIISLGEVVQVVAYIQDVEDMDNLDLLELTWQGTLDLTNAPSFADSTGRARWDVYDVPVGNHSLSYEVVDLAGDTSSAGVIFSVE